MLPDADYRHVAVAHSRIQQSLLFQIAHDEGIFGQLACQIDLFLVLVHDDEIGVCGVKLLRQCQSEAPHADDAVYGLSGFRLACRTRFVGFLLICHM